MKQRQDPSMKWAEHLDRLDPMRRDWVVGALEHSGSEAGEPVSEPAVKLLVAYALGEITAAAYASGILASLGLAGGDVSSRPVNSSEPEQADKPEPSAEHTARKIDRTEAVQAYVSGQIDMGEFLRIAGASV